MPARGWHIVTMPPCNRHAVIRGEQRTSPFNINVFILSAPDQQHLALMTGPAFKLHDPRFQTTHVRQPQVRALHSHSSTVAQTRGSIATRRPSAFAREISDNSSAVGGSLQLMT